MAGIAGIYCADGRPADLAELKRMVAAVEHRGPDGISYWNAGPVAFAHLQFCTTPESLEERQPLVSPGGDVCLVWNGRVDNREELRDLLKAEGAVPVDETDPGFVLAAFLAWGPDCVQKIVGDFALAVWDARHRRLWCARDFIGVRPFYYFWDGKTFLFGPEVRALLAHPLVSLKVNEGMVGEYLANAITSREETLYSDIQRLPSGFTLTIDGQCSLRVDSWWKPELSLLQYRTDAEYAEHFRELFDQSVRAQIRCNTPWGIELSGGLDSSSIAVSARAVLEASVANESRILAFSVVEPGKPWDESEDIREVVDKANLTCEFLEPLRVDIEFFRQRAGLWRDYPGSPNGEPITLPMYGAAKRQGARVLLSGIGGDEWLDGRAEWSADVAAGLFRRGLGRELIARAKADWREYSDSWHWLIFLLRRLLSVSVPHWARFRRRKRALESHGIFSEDFLARTRLAERIFAPGPETRRFASRTQRSMFQLITSGFEAYVLEANDRETAQAGIELRFPFFDRRFAEFCLRLPEDQRQRGAVWKRVMRNAMVGRLPERVRTKGYKAEFTELFESIFSAPPSLNRIQNLVMRSYGDWFEPVRMEERIATAVRAKPFERSGPGALWRMLSTDLWVEHITASLGEVSWDEAKSKKLNGEAFHAEPKSVP